MSKYPSSLSFERRLDVSDALFFNVAFKDDLAQRLSPVAVVRRGIRGILGSHNAAGSKDAKGGVSQIQVTEYAQTSTASEGLMVTFTVQPLSLREGVSGCNESSYRKELDEVFAQAAGSKALVEIGRRYARNMLNGRWLWRNRTLGAPRVTVAWGAESVSGTKGALNFDAPYTEAELKLGQAIADSFAGQLETTFQVEGVIRFAFAGSREVYPSQPYVNEKPKGFARALYKVNALGAAELRDQLQRDGMETMDMLVMGDAAMTGAKVANALRTIDTWHEPNGVPIAVEPNGANMDSNEFHRAKGNDAYSLMQDLPARVAELAVEGEPVGNAMYLLALMVRGAVLGVNPDKAAKADTPATPAAASVTPVVAAEPPVEVEAA